MDSVDGFVRCQFVSVQRYLRDGFETDKKESVMKMIERFENRLTIAIKSMKSGEKDGLFE